MNNEKLTWKIYKATSNTTGRCYVGCSSYSIAHRMNHHNTMALQYISARPFHRAIRELGLDDFRVEVLDETDDKSFALEVLEPSYIEIHKAFKEGYNATKGGMGKRGFEVSSETRKRLRLSALNLGLTPPNPRGKRWITNGVQTCYLKRGERLPKGYQFGRNVKHRISV